MEYNKLYESPPGAVTDFVKDVVSNVDDIDSLGSIDALNQAARRYNRKLMPQQAEMETGFPWLKKDLEQEISNYYQQATLYPVNWCFI